MTRPYLLLVRSSSSSIGGLVMPSGAGATPDTGGRVSSIDSGRKPAGAVPATGLLVGAGAPAQAGRRRSQQALQLVGGAGAQPQPGRRVSQHASNPGGSRVLFIISHDPINLSRRLRLVLGEREPA